MNGTQEKLLLKRVEKFGDAMAGGLAAAGATVLVKDGSVVVANIALACVMFAVAIALYFAFSWLLNELAASLGSDDNEVTEEEGDG